MLNTADREAALEIVMTSTDPEDFPAVNDRLCREFPSIELDDLVSIWRASYHFQNSRFF